MIRYLILVTLVLSQLAWAEVPYFLSSSELEKLTIDEQISYFREVQSIIVEMSENSSYMAGTSQNSRQIANIGEDEDIKYLMQYLEKNNLTEDQYENYRKIAISTPLEKRNTEEYKKAHQIWNGFNTYHGNQVSQKKFKALNEAEKKERDRKDAEEKAIKEKERIENESRYAEWKKNFKTPSYFEVRKIRKQINEANRLAKIREQEKVKTDFRQSEISSTPKKELNCLFAGWVLETDRCRGPQEFPPDFNIPGVDREKMKCQKGQFLCQPLLFGLKLPTGCQFLKDCASQARPLCVGFESAITKACQQNSFSTTKVAVELATQKDSRLFDQYRGEFYALCDPEMLSRNSRIQSKKSLKLDVEKTCKVASEKLQFLYLKNVNLSEPAKDTKPNSQQK